MSPALGLDCFEPLKVKVDYETMNQSASPTQGGGSPPEELSTEGGGGGGEDPWASAAAPPGDGEGALTHNEGETFSMPQTHNSTTASPTRANEILTALSNLGSVISAKAREVDQQAGISTKVADVNQKYHVSEKWHGFTEATRQKSQEINEKYLVSEKWTNFRGSVAARVEQMKEDRRKRMEEASGDAGAEGGNLATKLNGATTWVSQRIQSIRSAGSVDENDGREAELPESK